MFFIFIIRIIRPIKKVLFNHHSAALNLYTIQPIILSNLGRKSTKCRGYSTRQHGL